MFIQTIVYAVLVMLSTTAAVASSLPVKKSTRDEPACTETGQ